MGDWININEKMPQEHKDFIDLFDSNGLFITCEACTISNKVIVAVMDYDGQYFVDCDSTKNGQWINFDEPLYKVTHWMEFPDVPIDVDSNQITIKISYQGGLNIKLWIDDIRQAPDGYIWCKSVNEAKHYICKLTFEMFKEIELIDIDHDAGEYVSDGGDYIKLLDWLELMGYNYPIHIHSMNPVGVQNMRMIINKNGWKEV